MSKRMLLLAVIIFILAMAVTASAVCNTSTSDYTASNCDTCSNCDIASCLSCINCDNANCDSCSNCQNYTDLTNCLNNGTCPTASWTADYSKLSAALNDASTCANSGCGYKCPAVENASTCQSGNVHFRQLHKYQRG